MVSRLVTCSLVCWTTLTFVPCFAKAEESVPASEDPILAAKRDYAAIQARRVGLEQGSSTSPRAQVPRLERLEDVPPLLSPMQRARILEAEKKRAEVLPSRTWLIDALRDNAKSSAGKTEHSTGPRYAADPTLLNDTDAERLEGPLGSHPKISNRASDANSDRPPRAEIRNPLDAYMSQWMTARDFQLLTTSPEQSDPDSMSVPSSSTSITSNLDAAPFLVGQRPNIVVGNTDLLSHQWTAENPYVEKNAAPVVLSPPVISPREHVHQSTNPTQLSEENSLMAPELVPRSKPSAADLLKADDGSRHFKQLKRF